MIWTLTSLTRLVSSENILRCHSRPDKRYAIHTSVIAAAPRLSLEGHHLVYNWAFHTCSQIPSTWVNFDPLEESSYASLHIHFSSITFLREVVWFTVVQELCVCVFFFTNTKTMSSDGCCRTWSLGTCGRCCHPAPRTPQTDGVTSWPTSRGSSCLG